MWFYIKYIFIALTATIAGAVSGMGGGVLMKPAMDASGDFSASVIGLLTSVTVLVMAVISVIRQSRNKMGTEIKLIPSIALAVGSAAGGVGGQALFGFLTRNAADGFVKAIQNIVLAVLIVLIIAYMLSKDKIHEDISEISDGTNVETCENNAEFTNGVAAETSIQTQRSNTNYARIKPLSLKHPAAYILTGAALGVLSSFLGIGGGPMNVAVLIFVFGMSMRSAVLGSLITIMAAQGAKLATMGVTGFPVIDGIGWVLLIMAVAGAAGGLFGSMIQKRMSDRAVKIFFNCVQVIVLALCVYNIVKYSIL